MGEDRAAFADKPARKDDRLILSGIMHVLKASANFQLRFRPKGR
jgi:hypothetical protein